MKKMIRVRFHSHSVTFIRSTIPNPKVSYSLIALILYSRIEQCVKASPGNYWYNNIQLMRVIPVLYLLISIHSAYVARSKVFYASISTRLRRSGHEGNSTLLQCFTRCSSVILFILLICTLIVRILNQIEQFMNHCLVSLLRFQFFHGEDGISNA